MVRGMNTRFRVYDASDLLCGVWYAHDEITAIRAAISEGYDAWSAVAKAGAGW